MPAPAPTGARTTLCPWARRAHLQDRNRRQEIYPPRRGRNFGRRSSCDTEVTHHTGLEMFKDVAVEHPISLARDEGDIDALLRHEQNRVRIVDRQIAAR